MGLALDITKKEKKGKEYDQAFWFVHNNLANNKVGKLNVYHPYVCLSSLLNLKNLC